MHWLTIAKSDLIEGIKKNSGCAVDQSFLIWYMMMSSFGNVFHVSGPLWGESTVHWWIPLTKASSADLWWILSYTPEQMVEQTVELLVIWDTMSVM